MGNVFEALDRALVLAGRGLPLLAAAFAAAAAVSLYLRNRRHIVFEAWVNMGGGDDEAGRKIGDLLLFKLRFVKSIHEVSRRALDTWRPHQDLPPFRQGLDEDIKLLGSVELGKYGGVVGTIVTLLFRLVPLVFQPSRMRGSLHRYGTQTRLLAQLERRRRAAGEPDTLLWEVRQHDSSEESLPEAVEELAYRIYLDLSGEDVFKSWEAFRDFTLGMSHYVRYVDLRREADYEGAEEAYRRSLAEEPNNPAVCYALGILKYFRFDDALNQEATRLFRTALNATQSKLRALAHAALASALATQYHRFHSRDPQLLLEAKQHGHLALLAEPKLDGAHKAYAYACHQLSESYRAQRAEPGAPTNLPDLEEAHRELAIEHYRRAYALNPRHFVAHNNLANLYLEWATSEPLGSSSRTEHLQSALRECEATLRIHPSYYHAYDNLGNCHYQLGQLAEAAAAFRSALQYEPDYPEARNDLAMLHLEPTGAEFDRGRAFAGHADALGMIDHASGQRAKLCAQFSERVRRCGGVPEVLSPEARGRLERFGCTCLPGRADRATDA